LRDEILNHVLKPALVELTLDGETEVFINPSGWFVLGGFEADTGLTGRKLMADTYGGFVPHGGGALSGKDGTKVDRSGAYMARYIAKNIVAAGLAARCTVSLAYAIGKSEPVAIDVDTGSTGEYDDEVIAKAVKAVFDLRPGAIIRTLGLNRPIFTKTTNYGHFTKGDLPWERGQDGDAG
jgi:S-adenosylmethionine synthetase